MRKRGQSKDVKKTLPKGYLTEAMKAADYPLMLRSFVPDTERRVVTAYMCGVDWECEIGQHCHGVEIYRSIEDLRANKTCTHECGIVEVEVTIKKTVQPQDI
jgi:hypothetical protein